MPHFLLIRFALDIPESWQPFLLTALKPETWHTLLTSQPVRRHKKNQANIIIPPHVLLSEVDHGLPARKNTKRRVHVSGLPVLLKETFWPPCPSKFLALRRVWEIEGRKNKPDGVAWCSENAFNTIGTCCLWQVPQRHLAGRALTWTFFCAEIDQVQASNNSKA